MKSIYIITLIASLNVFAQQHTEERCNKDAPTVECGWHYGYIDPLGDLINDDKEKPVETPTAEKPEKKEQDCSKKEEWTEECGFIDPGTDYEFMAKQRDIFLQNLFMKSNETQAVENMQRFQKWMLNKAIEASNIWEYNLTQKPELSASFKNPVNTIGLRLATRLNENHEAAVLSEISEQGGFLVWFTRTDCVYCNQQLFQMKQLAKETNLELRNVSLDEQCYTSVDERCISAPESTTPATLLGVDVVPSIYLYLDNETYVRISNGAEANKTIVRRLKNFFLGVRNAQLNKSDEKVDFSNLENQKLNGGIEIK